MAIQLTRRQSLTALVGGIAALFGRASGAKSAVPEPLFNFAVAGGFYYGMRGALDNMAAGDRLFLRPEPTNRYDPNAIEVLDGTGEKLGYIPRKATGAPLAALAEGRVLEAEIIGFAGADDPEGLVFTGYIKGDPIIRLSAA